MDKAEFPRDKPCGGGVNIRAARLLPFDIAPVTERVIYGVRFSICRTPGFTRRWHEPLTYLTQRCRLDTHLVEQALLRGVTFLPNTPVQSIERHASCVLVRAGNGTFQGRTLVAADGANGPTARLAGLTMERSEWIGLEGNVTPLGGVPVEWQDTVGLDIGDVPGGYGWLFAKGDHLNLGVAGWRHAGPSMRERLERLTRFFGFDPSKLWGLRGHFLPLRRPHAPLVDGDVLLVGDAAGLVDSVSGEGIYAAIWSGRLAARHLAEYVGGQVRDLRGYQRQVEKEFVPELNTGQRIHELFHLAPASHMRLLERFPRLWRAACRLVRGDESYVSLQRKLGPFYLGLGIASDLARVTARLRRRA